VKKIVIAVDLDDVPWEFNAAFVVWHNQRYGTNFTYADLYTFNMSELYQETHEEMVHRVHLFVTEAHHTIKAAPHAPKVLKGLSQLFDLQAVTSRAESVRQVTEDHIRLLEIDIFSRHHFTNGFSQPGVHKKRTKLEVCREIGAVVLIEDAIENAESVAEGGIPVLMPIHPWNRTFTHPLVTKFTSWKEIPNLTEKLLSQQ
jgi:uncharacterized HAD superfamily protein